MSRQQLPLLAFHGAVMPRESKLYAARSLEPHPQQSQGGPLGGSPWVSRGAGCRRGGGAVHLSLVRIRRTASTHRAATAIVEVCPSRERWGSLCC